MKGKTNDSSFANQLCVMRAMYLIVVAELGFDLAVDHRKRLRVVRTAEPPAHLFVRWGPRLSQIRAHGSDSGMSPPLPLRLVWCFWTASDDIS